MPRVVVLVALGVLPLVGCGSTSDQVTVSATTRAAAPSIKVPPADPDAPYRFVKPPLVVMDPRGSSRALPLYRVMVRVRPGLPPRANPNRPNSFAMRLDGAPNTVMSRKSDECYSAEFDREMAESGGPQNPPPVIFVRPKVGTKVTVSVLYHRPGQRFRSFSTEAVVRRASPGLWKDFERRGLRQQGCKLRGARATTPHKH